MKNKKQIQHELHDKLTRQLVELELEVVYLRLENRTKQKEKAMLDRDEVELKIRLLDELID